MKKLALILIMLSLIIGCENIAGKMSTVPPVNLHLEVTNQNNELLVEFIIYLTNGESIESSGTAFVKIINNGDEIVYDKAITILSEDFEEKNTAEGTVTVYEFEIPKEDLLETDYISGNLDLSLSTNFWTLSEDTVVFGLPIQNNEETTTNSYVDLPTCGV
jgi:hypothetical protein